MLCGEHTTIKLYDNILNDILKDEFFDVIECDDAIPDHLKAYFSEMTSIFKNSKYQLR